jgi:rhodanese-related sulfurtransferase
MRPNSDQQPGRDRQHEPRHVPPPHTSNQFHARLSTPAHRVRPVPKTVDELLADARARLGERFDPQAASEAIANNDAVLVDIRSESQRAEDGTVPMAIHIPRNVLEWRCDPRSEYRDERVCDPERRLILMCDAGYQSSLAAAVLQDLGHAKATDLDGGFQAWRAAGLPTG